VWAGRQICQVLVKLAKPHAFHVLADFFHLRRKVRTFRYARDVPCGLQSLQVRDLGDENARAFASLKSASTHFHGLKERANIASKEDQNYRLG
jgi:hypothetical protein